MPQPLPTLLRSAGDALSGAAPGRDELHGLLSELITHPALTPALAEPPARAPAIPPVSAVVLAKLTCEVAHRGKLHLRIRRRTAVEHPLPGRPAAGLHRPRLQSRLVWGPLVHEQFDLFSGDPSLASLRSLDGRKFRAEDSPAVLAADTFPVAPRHRAVVRAIVDSHGTWGKLIDERLAK